MSVKKYWLYETVEDDKDQESEVDSDDSDLEDDSDEDPELSLDDSDEEDPDDQESEVDLDLDADDSEDGDDLDLSLDDPEDDLESDGEELFDDSEADEEIEIENLQDDESLEIGDLGGDLPRDSELDFNDESESGSGFDSWLEDAGVTGEVSNFENFDELPENEDLESDSDNDEFGVEARTAFVGREKVGPSGVEEAIAAGRTLQYDEQERWIADTRRNGYRVKPSGGAASTKDQIWKAFYKDGSEVGRFSQEEGSGHLSFVVSEGRDVLRLFETAGGPPLDPKSPTQRSPNKPAVPKSKYQFDSEEKVPQNAKWFMIQPSKIKATDVDDAAEKVKQAGIPVLFAKSAYGKAKIAYSGSTLRQKVNDALVKLGLGEDEASGIAGGRTELESDPQQADGTRAGIKASQDGTSAAVDGSDQESEDLSSQVDDDPDYQPQRADHPEEEPDEDTLHISVKGTDEVVASLKDAGIKVKSFGNHKDGDYIRVDAMDAAKAHEWMLSHGWDENEAQHAVGTAKSKASLAPIKKVMQDVLGDKAPNMNSHEDFAEWLRGAHGEGEESTKEGSEDFEEELDTLAYNQDSKKIRETLKTAEGPKKKALQDLLDQGKSEGWAKDDLDHDLDEMASRGDIKEVEKEFYMAKKDKNPKRMKELKKLYHQLKDETEKSS